MKSIAIKDLSENFFEVIGKEWMLVTAGSKEHFNTMTASWGGIGWLWNKPVVFVFIRSERYTYEFMEENEYFTLEPKYDLYQSDIQLQSIIFLQI